MGEKVKPADIKLPPYWNKKGKEKKRDDYPFTREHEYQPYRDQHRDQPDGGHCALGGTAAKCHVGVWIHQDSGGFAEVTTR